MDNLFKRTKLNFIAIPLISIVCLLSILYFFAYYYVQGMVINRMSEDAKSTAVAVAYIIEDDLENYNKFIEDRIAGTDYFNKMLAIFTRLKAENTAIKYIYTVRRTGENTTEFALDADYANNVYKSGDKITFIQEEENTVTLHTMNTGKVSILPPTNSIHYGILIGASAPIFSESGEVIGTVGIDIDLQTVYHNLNNLLILLISIGLVIILFSLIVLIKSSDTFLQDVVKDKLTKAYNKKYTNKIILNGINEARKTQKNYYSLLMLDLDHFKNVNDTYGHVFGDIVLASVSKIILDNIRKEDHFIRYGGEEFLISVCNYSMEQTEKLAERIRSSIENYKIYNRKHGRSINITISIGITSINGKDMDPTKMIELADKALYKAKETRNAVAVCLE